MNVSSEASKRSNVYILTLTIYILILNSILNVSKIVVIICFTFNSVLFRLTYL